MQATPKKTWVISMASFMFDFLFVAVPGFKDDLLMEFPDLFPYQIQNPPSFCREPVVFLRAPAPFRVPLAGKPAPLFQPGKQRVEGARADLVAVTPQLVHDPLAMHRLLPGMVQDMHLPKTQQYLAFNFPHITEYVIENRYKL